MHPIKDHSRFVKFNSWEGFGNFYDRVLPNTERDSVERYWPTRYNFYSDALPSAEPENGLLAYYKFELVSIEPDKLWDYSGNNHYGAFNFVNNAGRWQKGMSLNFDGINDTIRLPTITGDHKTFSFWIKPDTDISGTGEEMTIWNPLRGNGNSAFKINSGGSHFLFKYYAENTRSLSNSNIGVLIGWHHLVLSYDSQYSFYLNGTLLGTRQIKSSEHLILLKSKRPQRSP